MDLESNFDAMKFTQDLKDAVSRGKKIAHGSAEMRPAERALDPFRRNIIRQVENARAEGKERAKILHRVVRSNIAPTLNAGKTERATMTTEELAAFGLHHGDAYAELDGDEIGDSVCHLFFAACNAAGLHTRAFHQAIHCGHEYVLIADLSPQRNA